MNTPSIGLSYFITCTPRTPFATFCTYLQFMAKDNKCLQKLHNRWVENIESQENYEYHDANPHVYTKHWEYSSYPWMIYASLVLEVNRSSIIRASHFAESLHPWKANSIQRNTMICRRCENGNVHYCSLTIYMPNADDTTYTKVHSIFPNKAFYSRVCTITQNIIW